MIPKEMPAPIQYPLNWTKDVTVGNPHKLFRFVRDTFLNAGYDASPEKGGALVEPVISPTAIRDTGTFNAYIRGMKDKRIFPYIPAIVAGIVVAIAGLIFLLSNPLQSLKLGPATPFIGLFILIGGVGICFYKCPVRYNISAKFEGEAYYAGGAMQRAGVESVLSERASMIGEVRVYLDGCITNPKTNARIERPSKQLMKQLMELQYDFGMVVKTIEENLPNLAGLKEMIRPESGAPPGFPGAPALPLPPQMIPVAARVQLKCQYCDSPIQPGWKACPVCGNKLPLFCPHCGAIVQSGWKACPNCGEKL